MSPTEKKKVEWTIDEWLDAGYSDVDYLNYIKPLIIRTIREFVLKSEDSSPLEVYESKLLEKPDSKKKELFVAVVEDLKKLKKKAKSGDKVARIFLINYGLVRRSK